MEFHSFAEASAAWQAHRPMFEDRGIYLPDVKAYAYDEAKRDYRVFAQDALPSLSTDPNAGVPTMLTTMIDPAIYRVLFAQLKAAAILGEARKGTWLDQTAMFPIVEQTGEVSSYGDFNTNGRAGANSNWPQRQSYLFQTVPEYGELEVERAGLGRINWVSEVDGAAVQVLNRFQNTTYFYGVQGLQNYGILNDPGLSAAITPATKAYGGVKWVNNGVIVATANEVYSDVQSLYLQLVSQTNGPVEQDTRMVLALGTVSAVALTATNSFNVKAIELIKENFPNIRIERAVQYNALSATNPQGIAGGNEMQLIAEEVEGQQTGYCAYNEKLRAHPIVRELSSWKKKMTAGNWGAIIRAPANISSMIGI